MSRAQVILCRHGATAWNAKSGASKGVSQDRNEKIRGWKDVPLDPEGRKEARVLSDNLAREDIDEIRTSPLVRAAETAVIIAQKHPGIRPKPEPALKPWDVGEYAGKPTKEVLPKMEMLERMQDKRAPGGESFREFRERFLRCLIDLIREAHHDKKTVVAVAHTRNAQCARAWIAAGCRPDLKVDDDVMDDYEHEIGTGETLVIRC